MSALGIVLLTAECALAGPGGEGAALETYQKPIPVVSGGKVYLFARLGGPEENLLSVCFREDADNSWTRLGEFPANYTAIAHTDGQAFLFLPGSVLELRVADWTKTGESRWPFNWRPQSAEVVNGQLTAFGVSEGKPYFAAAEPEPPSTPRAETEAARAVLRPSQPGSGMLPSRWREVALSPAGEGASEVAREVKTLLIRNDLWLFWTTSLEGSEAQTLRAAVVKDGTLKETAKIAEFDGRIDFAPAILGDDPFIVYARVPARLTEDEPLHWRRYRAGQWSSSFPALQVTNSPLEYTYELVAVSQGGKVRLFVNTALRLLETRFDGVTWTPLQTVQSHPSVDWMMEHTDLMLAAGVIGLGLLVISLLRARSLPRRAVIGGIEYALAPWLRRACAYAFDLLFVAAVVLTTHKLMGWPLTMQGWLVGAFTFELFYLTVSEVRAGKTMGKRLFGLIVVSRNGGYPTWGESAVRNLPRLLTDSMGAFPMLLISSMVILNTRGSQRIGDLIAGTYVVRERVPQ